MDVSAVEGTPSVAVSDSGIGIAPGELERIFDRFHRTDAARQRTEGAGLGLSIARWIAEAHGARIEVASAEGQGSRFTVRFQRSG